MKTLLTGSCLFLSVLLCAQTFPDDWYGNWRGNLAIWRGGQAVDTVPMEFELSLADTGGINYIIRYLPGRRPVDEHGGRRYHLSGTRLPHRQRHQGQTLPEGLRGRGRRCRACATDYPGLA